MGVWQGVLQGLLLHEEGKKEREKLEAAKEEREFQRMLSREGLDLQRAAGARAERTLALSELTAADARKAALAKVQLDRQKMLLENFDKVMPTSSLGTPETRLEERFAAAMLKNTYGVSDETITRISAVGDPTALKRAYDKLEDQRKLYEGVGDVVQPETIGQLFETAFIEQPTDIPVDIDALYEKFGVEPDPFITSIIEGKARQPGFVRYAEPVYVKALDLETLNKAEQRIVQEAVTKAESELNLTQKEIGRIAEQLKSDTLDPTTRTELQATSQWLVNRLGQLNTAIKDANADTPNIAPVVRLYGNQAAQDLFEYEPRLKDAPLSSMFKAQITPEPLDVGSVTNLGRLYKAGIIRDGQEVTYKDNGEEFVEVVSPELFNRPSPATYQAPGFDQAPSSPLETATPEPQSVIEEQPEPTQVGVKAFNSFEEMQAAARAGRLRVGDTVSYPGPTGKTETFVLGE